MCESQPTWPVHLSGWHHCTHTPSISARHHRTMLLLVINIHTALAVLHAHLPLSARTPLLLLHTATNKQMHTLLEPLYLPYVHSGRTVTHIDCPFTQFCTHGWSPAPPSHPYKLPNCAKYTLSLFLVGCRTNKAPLVPCPVDITLLKHMLSHQSLTQGDFKCKLFWKNKETY